MLTRRGLLAGSVGAMTTQLLRATVQAPGNSGDDHTILVDGSDTPVTAQGRPGYAPVAGDRVLVQKVGGQVKNAGLDNGTQVITAAIFQSDDNVGLLSAGGVQGFILSDDGSGGVFKFYVGDANEQTPATINPQSGGLIIRGPQYGGDRSSVQVFSDTVSIFAADTGTSPGTVELNAGTGTGNVNLVARTVTLSGATACDLVVQSRVTANQLEMDGPPTTTSAANVFVGAGGLLNKVTSLRAHKLQRKPLASDAARAVLLVRPSTWFDKTQVEENNGSTAGLHRITGVIAEQVEEVAPHFATYDEDGELDGADYRALSVALIDVVRELEHRVAELEKRTA